MSEIIERIEIKLTQDRETKYHTVSIVPEKMEGDTLYFFVLQVLHPLMRIVSLELEAADD